MSTLVHQWQVEDVVEWMQSVGLGEFAPNFEANGVDGLSLLELTKQDLKGCTLGLLDY